VGFLSELQRVLTIVERCTADCEAHMNFADESVFLMADNVCAPLENIMFHGE
jgi:hypothetical protein